MQIYVNRLDSRERGNDVLRLRDDSGWFPALTNW